MKRLKLLLLPLLFALLVPLAHGQAFSDYLENKLADHVFRGVTFTPAGTLYVGLSTAACSDNSVGTEASYTGYARGAIVSSTTNWSATNGAGTTTNPSSGTAGTISNNGTVTIGSTASSGPTVVTHWFIADASSGGNIYICKVLSNSKTVNTADPAPTFSAGSLTITFQ